MATEYVKISSEEDADLYKKEVGGWVVAALDRQMGWPEKNVMVDYKGKRLLLLPEEGELCPAIAVRNCANEPEDVLRRVITSFLSELAWSLGGSASVQRWIGGGTPIRLGKVLLGPTRASKFRITYLPDPDNEKARLALAFFREAQGLGHAAYKFLSYYKIINLKYRTGEKQKAWFGRTIPGLADTEADKRVQELIAAGQDVADYLHGSCRCAVAHAGVKAIVDPESVEDERRLRADLPLIKKLAELMIEEEFHVKTPDTVSREHLYELAGFKGFIGDELSKALKDGTTVDVAQILLPHKLSIRLWGKKRYEPLEHMDVKAVQCDRGQLVVTCYSNEGKVQVTLTLDFPNEKIHFDTLDGIRIIDDGSSSIAEAAAELQRFIGDYFVDGSLELFEPERQQCIGRIDLVIPATIDVHITIENSKTAECHYREVASMRHGSSAPA